MQAVNLYFAVTGMEVQDYGPFQVRDKIPLKKDLEAAGVRIVPGRHRPLRRLRGARARWSCPAS